MIIISSVCTSSECIDSCYTRILVVRLIAGEARIMDQHKVALSNVCPVCGQRFPTLSKSTAYPAEDVIVELKECFGISVDKDVDGVHPPSICLICRQVVQRYHEAAATGCQSYTGRGGGC